MTAINETLNVIFADQNNTIDAAQVKLDEATNKAKAAFATTEAKAKDKADRALKTAAETFFLNGGTLDEFAEAYGKSTVTTRNHLKALGVDVPAGKKGARSKFTEDEKRDIATRWHEGDRKTRLTLALDNDVTEATMRNWAIELAVYEPVKRVKADAEAVAEVTADAEAEVTV